MDQILVMGYGVSGKAAAAFLKSQGKTVTIVDRKGGEGILPDTPDLDLTGFSQVIVSPGIPSDHPLIQKAKARSIEVIGEVEMAFRHIRNTSFGITGSNGKTTTVTLIAHILNAAGKKARALGNVGESLSSYLLQADPEEILIIELSSFQLETLQAKILDAALILNITPNHLDRHRDMQEYIAAKARIQNCLKEGAPFYVSSQILSLFPGAESFEKDLALIDTLRYTQLEMPSKQSVQAAYLLCKRCGVTDVDFLQGLSSYRKPAHRIEWVAEINQVTYYNDSKSSNIHSVLHAIERVEGPVVLIVGGVHKGSSYKLWIEPFKTKVRQIIAYGKAAPIIGHELSAHFPLVQVDRFADAVLLAKQIAKPSETVLLSPGCSSYDQFENYERRGEEFKRLVRELCSAKTPLSSRF